MPGGRPTKLNEKLHTEIVTLIENGNYLETAACAAGVDVATVRRWLKRGARAASGPYAEFCAAVKTAEAIAEARSLRRIRSAAINGVWQADAWYLERKFPSKWGRWERAPEGPPEDVDKARDYVKRKDVRDLLDDLADRISMDGDPVGNGEET